MEIVDLSKAVRRKTDSRRRDVRRISGEDAGIFSRIAKLQRTLDERIRSGDREGYFVGRRELCNLIFAVVSDDRNVRSGE